MKKRLLAITLISWFGILLSVAPASPFECPESIDAASTVTVVPKGWDAVPGGTRFPFESITVFDGHPRGEASLVPDRDVEDAKGKAAVSEWLFEGGAKDAWFTCSYRGVPSSLAMRIPDGARRCSVTAHHESWGWQYDRTITCDTGTQAPLDALYRDLGKTCDRISLPNSMAQENAREREARMADLEKRRAGLVDQFRTPAGRAYLESRLGGITDELERRCVTQALKELEGRGSR